LREVVRVGASPVQPAGTTGFTRPLAESGPSRIPLQNIEQTLGGEFRESAGRRSFLIVRRFEPDRSYGRATIGELADRLTAAAASAPLISVAAARAPFVFFDLETTGLSGGAGT